MTIKKLNKLFYLFLIITFISTILINSNLVIKRVSLVAPKISAGEITIITPENKTYTEPMSGYYPATIGFENDEDGSLPDKWIEYKDQSIMKNQIINEVDGHKKVLDMDKANTPGGDSNSMYQYFDQPQEWGTIEFWGRASDSVSGSAWHPNTDLTNHICGLGICDNQFQYYDDTGWHDIGKSANANTWYHLKIQFECGSGNHYGLNQYKWKAFIDQEEYGDFNFFINQTDINNFRIHQNWRYINYHTLTDAIGYSWDPNYNIGDNLNEGLLLSYENIITLDWMGYSLDEMSNITIFGNTTISFPDDGDHTIQVFGNSSVGIMHQSNIVHFSVDTSAPVITIQSPSPSEFFGVLTPNFNISIEESNLNTTWYNLNNGINITIDDITGEINQTEWDKYGNGTITIRFYANDTWGFEAFSEVSIFKDTIAPTTMISFTPHSGINIVNKSTYFTIISNDGLGSGVSLIRYKINDSVWLDYNAPFDLSGYDPGFYLITYYAIDMVGNIEEENSLLVELKEITSKPEIVGYNLILLIGIISIVSIVLTNKFHKNKK